MAFPDEPADPLDALREECEQLSATVAGLSEADFGRPTRCTAWDVKVLFAHVHRGIHRMVVAVEEPAPLEADADSVSYWRAYDPAAEAGDISDRAKEVAGAHATGRDLALAWGAMWPKTLALAGRTDRGRVVRTWGPALTLDEFLKTRVLETTVHRMDLEDALGRRGWGTDQAISIIDEILEGLLGAQPPRGLDWDVVDFIETGCGRRPLTDQERKKLGKLAARFPLIG